MSSGNGKETDRDRMARAIRRLHTLLTTPIDFDRLIADGSLRDSGRGWYEVLDWSKVPEHARRQASEVKEVQDGKKVTLYLRFRRIGKRRGK